MILSISVPKGNSNPCRQASRVASTEQVARHSSHCPQQDQIPSQSSVTSMHPPRQSEPTWDYGPDRREGPARATNSQWGPVKTSSRARTGVASLSCSPTKRPCNAGSVSLMQMRPGPSCLSVRRAVWRDSQPSRTLTTMLAKWQQRGRSSRCPPAPSSGRWCDSAEPSFRPTGSWDPRAECHASGQPTR